MRFLTLPTIFYFLCPAQKLSARNQDGIPGCPLSCFDHGQEIENYPIEEVRLLEINGMSALRKGYESGGGDISLHEDRGFDARLVFVADQKKGRHLNPFQLGFQGEDRRAPQLYPLEGQSGTHGRMILQLGQKFFPSPGIFPPQLDSGRSQGVRFGDLRHPLLLQTLSQGLPILFEFLAVGGPGAAPGDHKGRTHPRVPDPHMEGYVAAHGQACDMSFGDLEVAQEMIEIIHHGRLGISLRICGNFGGGITPVVIGEHPVAP